MTEKKSDTWMPFYVGDYLSATSRLTTEQHGAYFLILIDYWKNGPPPNDDTVLAQIARLPIASWRKARPALIAFFDIQDGYLIQKRVEKERAKASDITDERSKAGKIGAARRWQNHGKGDDKPMANAMAKPLANAKQTDAPSQPPKKKELTLSPTTSREPPPPGIADAALALNYVCLEADWRPANDTQRQVAISIINGWLALGCTLELVLAGIAQARKRDPAPTRSLKRFDSTIRGMRSDQLGGELPVSTTDVSNLTGGIAANLRAN